MLRGMVVREKTLKYWLVGGPVMALGSNQYWGMHRYTRRVRLWLYLSLLAIGILLAASLVTGYTPKRWLPPTRPGPSVIAATVVSIASAYLAVRLMTLPVLLYGAWVASRVRRSDGGLCWDCGRIAESEQAEGCGCGSRWSREELRRFWIATELLPASKEQLRTQRHLLRGESASQASSPRHWALRFLTPLPRDQMICWQQRPITKRWVQRAMYVGAGLSAVLFAVLVVATIPLVRTLQSGALSPFVSGMLLFGAGTIISQFFVLRGSLRYCVKRAKKQVRECDGLLCTDCGFVLTGLGESAKCPECGEQYTEEELQAFYRSCGLLERAS